MLRKDDRRIVLVAGRAAQASDLGNAVSDRQPLTVSLHSVPAVKRNKIILSPEEIKAGRSKLLD